MTRLMWLARAAPLALFLLSDAATGADWSLGMRVGQQFDVDSNRALEIDDVGQEPVSFGSESTIGFDLGADTETTTWGLSTNLRYTAYSGLAPQSNLGGFRPFVVGAVEHTAPNFAIGSDFTFVRNSTSAGDFFEPGIGGGGVIGSTTQETTRTFAQGGAGLTIPLTATNTIVLDASGSVERFQDDDLGFEPNSSVELAGTWRHSVNHTNNIGLRVTALGFVSDNETTLAQNRTQSYSVAAIYDGLVTPRFDLSSSLGFSYTDEEDEILIDGVKTDFDNTSFGVVGSLGVEIRRKNSTLNLAFDHSVRPTGFGNVRNVSSLIGNYSYTIDPRTRINLPVAYAYETGAVGGGVASESEFSGDNQRVNVGPVLIYDLTQNWNTRLAYVFQLLDDDGGTAISHTGLVQFQRTFSIFR